MRATGSRRELRQSASARQTAPRVQFNDGNSNNIPRSSIDESSQSHGCSFNAAVSDSSSSVLPSDYVYSGWPTVGAPSPALASSAPSPSDIGNWGVPSTGGVMFGNMIGNMINAPSWMLGQMLHQQSPHHSNRSRRGHKRDAIEELEDREYFSLLASSNQFQEPVPTAPAPQAAAATTSQSLQASSAVEPREVPRIPEDCIALIQSFLDSLCTSRYQSISSSKLIPNRKTKFGRGAAVLRLVCRSWNARLLSLIENGHIIVTLKAEDPTSLVDRFSTMPFKSAGLYFCIPVRCVSSWDASAKESLLSLHTCLNLSIHGPHPQQIARASDDPLPPYRFLEDNQFDSFNSDEEVLLLKNDTRCKLHYFQMMQTFLTDLPHRQLSSSLTHLDLSFFGPLFSDMLLLHLLSSGACITSRLSYLRLKNNQITDAGARAIATHPHFQNLHTLDLCGNAVRDFATVVFIAAAAFSGRKSCGTILLRSDEKNKEEDAKEGATIDEDDEDCDGEEEDECGEQEAKKELPPGLLPSLRALRMSGNEFIDHIRMDSIPSVHCDLEELDLAVCSLRGSDIQGFISLLPRLRSLDISGNNFHTASVWQLCSSPHLCRLRRLYLRDISAEKPSFIPNALTTFPQITSQIRELDLSGLPLGDQGLLTLLMSPMASNLTLLRIGDCELTADSIDNLARIPMRQLRNLDISSNPMLLTDASVRVLKDSETFSTLTHLSINRSTNLSARGLQTLLASSHLRSRLQSFSARHCNWTFTQELLNSCFSGMEQLSFLDLRGNEGIGAVKSSVTLLQ